MHNVKNNFPLMIGGKHFYFGIFRNRKYTVYTMCYDNLMDDAQSLQFRI